MAATMISCRTCSRFLPIFKIPARQATTQGYYVLLPEVPPDTPETNVLLRPEEYPEFSKITDDSVITGCAKLAITYDVQLGKHIENLGDPNVTKSFSNVFDPIEKITAPLNYAWRTAKNLNYVKTEPYREAFLRVHPQVERARNERWISESLHNAVKEVNADQSNLNVYQQRLVDMYLLEARLNGIELTGDDKRQFIRILGNLVESKNHFRNRMMLSQNMFKHFIEDYSIVVDLPRSLVIEMAMDKKEPSRGPWKVTLNQNVYRPFLEYCSHRLLRWNIWQAFNNRSSLSQDEQNLSNHLVIKDIRTHRRDMAKMLGYENFAEMSMETKMAGSIDNVLGLIESLKAKFQPIAEEEVACLQEFAQSEGFTAKLEMWDLPYWRRRQREHLFKIVPAELAQFFPLPKVLDGMFEFCQKTFGIEIKDCTGEVDTWHDSVLFYKVYNQGDDHPIAAFYVDPYSRASKLSGVWMEAGREHSSIAGLTPISYLNLNFNQPLKNIPSLLTVDEVAMLFMHFGQGLQQMLTTVPYSEIAGQRNIEWDALQTCPQLMSMFVYTKTMLRSLSGHFQTGQPLSDDNITAALQLKSHMSAYDMMHQLYLSAYDMEMYISTDAWYDVMSQTWKDFIPLPLHEDDNHPCALSSIFADQYAAAYYSVIWSEMLAADVFKAFEEAEQESAEKAALVGQRFRETFLSLGGGVPANEVFRRFRGRDPSQDALLHYRGVF